MNKNTKTDPIRTPFYGAGVTAAIGAAGAGATAAAGIIGAGAAAAGAALAPVGAAAVAAAPNLLLGKALVGSGFLIGASAGSKTAIFLYSLFMISFSRPSSTTEARKLSPGAESLG